MSILDERINPLEGEDQLLPLQVFDTFRKKRKKDQFSLLTRDAKVYAFIYEGKRCKSTCPIDLSYGYVRSSSNGAIDKFIIGSQWHKWCTQNPVRLRHTTVEFAGLTVL